MAKQIATSKAPAPKAPPTPASKAPPPKASAAPPPAKGTPADAGASINPKAPPGKAPPPPKAAAPSNGAASAPPTPSQGTAAHVPPADKAGDAIKALLAKQAEQIKALSLAIAEMKQNGVRTDAVDVSAILSDDSPAVAIVMGADENDPRLGWHGKRVKTVFFDTNYDKKTGWHTVRSPGRTSVGILAIPADDDPGGKGTMARNNGQMAYYYNFKADGSHEGAPLYVFTDELTGDNGQEKLVLAWHDGADWNDY